MSTRGTEATFKEWLLNRCDVVDAGYTTPCWLWLGSKSKGYAKGSIPVAFGTVRRIRVHREAYIRLVGPIPEGLVADHLCRNRACCNPEHLEPVTSAVNIERGMSWLKTPESAREFNRRRFGITETHCSKGHEFTPENTRISHDGRRRRCGRCKVERERQYNKTGYGRELRLASNRAWRERRRMERLNELPPSSQILGV